MTLIEFVRISLGVAVLIFLNLMEIVDFKMSKDGTTKAPALKGEVLAVSSIVIHFKTDKYANKKSCAGFSSNSTDGGNQQLTLAETSCGRPV